MDTIASMRAFVAVAKTGSFSAAAQKLDLVPSVITKRVTQLERIVGTTLFHRSTRKVVLSADGEHHLERIIAAIAAHDQASEHILKLYIIEILMRCAKYITTRVTSVRPPHRETQNDASVELGDAGAVAGSGRARKPDRLRARTSAVGCWHPDAYASLRRGVPVHDRVCFRLCGQPVGPTRRPRSLTGCCAGRVGDWISRCWRDPGARRNRARAHDGCKHLDGCCHWSRRWRWSLLRSRSFNHDHSCDPCWREAA